MDEQRLRTRRDEHGRLRLAEPLPASPLVSDFLETDIREDSVSCRRVLAGVDECLAGTRDHAEFVGNAYVLRVEAERALLRDLYDEEAPPEELRTGDLRGLLEAWCRAVEQG